MKLRELSGLSDFRWKELNKTVYWELREQQSHIGPEQKNSALFYDWIDRFLASGIGERFWGKTEGGSLEFPKDRPTIWRILRLVASMILGQMRAFAEGRSKMLAVTGLDSAAYARIKAAQDPQYDSRSKEYVRPTKDKLKIADENTPKKIAKTRLNKRPRTNLSYPDHSNGSFEPHINNEKSAADVRASVATLRPYSKFPHLFITHIATPSTIGPRKHHLIDIAEPISLQTFLEKVRVRAEDETEVGRQITRVHIEIAGRDVNISMDDSEGEWEWGLVMGILMYSGISMGSSTYVRCVMG